jgi:hypothetical protein
MYKRAMSVTTFTYSNGTTSTSTDTTLTSSSYSVPSGQSLTGVSVGSNVTSLANDCFFNCSNLSSVTFLGTQVTSFGIWAFANCNSLRSIIIPSSVTSLTDYCFYSSGLTSIEIPSSITSLGNNCFNTCTSLQTVIFDNQNNITSYGSNSFTNSNNLNNVIYYNTANQSALSATSLAYQPNFPNNPTFIYRAGASCFHEGTQILCLNNQFEEQWVPVEQLQQGDLVKTYLHGYRKIAFIGKGHGKNIEKGSLRNLYQHKHVAEGWNKPLQMTGWHAKLVNHEELTQELRDQHRQLLQGVQQEIDNKTLMLAGLSPDFEEMELGKEFMYYNLVVEPNEEDPEQRFGIWANGILCETPNQSIFVKHHFVK